MFGLLLIERWGRQADGSYLFTLFDDAAISKTYARTLSQTGEFVWFPGADRVEGVSNLLWTLVMAAVHAAGFSGSSAALVISLIGLSLLTFHALQVGHLTLRLLSNQNERKARLGSSLAILVTGTAYPLLFWTLRGFETGLIALLYVLLLHKALDIEEGLRGRRRRQILIFGILVVVLALVRLDALVVPIAVTVWILHRKLLTRFEIAQLAIFVGAGIALLLAWRFAYFGSFVPNTYFLKVSDAPTTIRIQRGLSTVVKLLPLVALTLLALRADGRRLGEQLVRPARWQLVALVFGGLIAYSVYVGGDAWEWSGFANRFVTPGLGISVAAASASFVKILGNESIRLPMPTFRTAALLSISSCAATLAIWGGEVVAFVVRSTSFDQIVADRLGYGKNAQPSDWADWFTTRFAEPMWLGFGLSLVLLVLVFHYRGRARLAAPLAALLLVGAVWSAPNPIRAWSRALSGIHVADDAFMVNFGLAIRDATTEDAKVAIVWAGNPAYYSERAMIDLLGKSDSTIARLRPSYSSWRELHPGHNKWDYAYSIATLRPDLVAQTWGLTEEEIEDFQAWGYEAACLGRSRVFVAEESERVDRAQVRPLIGESCSFNFAAKSP